MKKPEIGCSILVDCYNYKKKEIEQLKGKVLAIVTALDREYRVNVILENGREINEAAPECIHPLSHLTNI